MGYKSKNMQLGGQNDIDNDLFLDYIRIIDNNSVNVIDEHNYNKLFKHKDVFPTPFQTKALKPYQRLYIPFTKRLFGNDAVNFQFNVPGTDYSFSEGKVAEYFPAQPAKMFIYLLNKETTLKLKEAIHSGDKEKEQLIREIAKKVYNTAVIRRDQDLDNLKSQYSNPEEINKNKNEIQMKFVLAIKKYWSLHEIDHADWVSLLKNKSVIPEIKLKSLVPKLEYVQIWNNFAPCSGPNGMTRSKPECLYIGSQNHNEMAPGASESTGNHAPRGCVWLGKSQGCKECKSLKTVEECGKFPVQCGYNKSNNECIPRTLQDEYNVKYNLNAEGHISKPIERELNRIQRSTRHVHPGPDDRLLIHEHPEVPNHKGHSALEEMQARLNKTSSQNDWSYGYLDKKAQSYENVLPNRRPSDLTISEELATSQQVDNIMKTQGVLNALQSGGKKKSRKSSKRRVSKKRVSKKRVSKRRVSKRRVSKRRVSKRRVSKKKVSRKRRN